MNEKRTKLLIIGSGPAGYTAGIYAARAMLQPILLQGIQAGGQLTITTEVENYPPFAEIQGPELMQQMEEHCKASGAEVIADHVEKVDLSSKPFFVKGSGDNNYLADSIILATGAQARWLGLESEQRLRGHGVSACATCDGFFFRDQRVIVIGGGNTAVEEALFLTRFASEVILVHRRDSLRAEAILVDRLKQNNKISILWNSELDEVLSTSAVPAVDGVRLRNVLDGSMQEVACTGVFVAIGHSPASELVRDQLDVDESGYVIVQKGTTMTSCKGVFAAGDITDKIYRQAITSAGMGCMAALDAARWIEEQ